MADPLHHAESSVRKWGGTVEDYIAIHAWFDASKQSWADPRHRAMRHHAEGIVWMMETFARAGHDGEGNPVEVPALTNSAGRDVPLRYIGEQHVLEDLGCIPTMKDWLEDLPTTKRWMRSGARRLEREFRAGSYEPTDIPSEGEPST